MPSGSSAAEALSVTLLPRARTSSAAIGGRFWLRRKMRLDSSDSAGLCAVSGSTQSVVRTPTVIGWLAAATEVASE